MLAFIFGALTALLASQSARASLAPALQARALTAIQGTYNTTFVHVVTSKDHAQSLVPSQYPLLPVNKTLYPGLSDDQHPIVLELGREANAGPPGLGILSFQEAKIEVPDVQRVSDSDRPFLHKRWIAVDDGLDVVGSWVQYGLNTSLETFAPANSSNSSSYSYTVQGAIEAELSALSKEETPRFGLDTYTTGATLPWFGTYLLCAQHTYNFTHPVEPFVFTKGTVTLYPPYAGPNATGPITLEAAGVHVTASFDISYALACSEFF
ncbi:hypothetical protein HETIRDRAFT_431393 [Heterobasidion irregulare TC 32-1]|uniref:Uncharacterized protein n=1 Tax=Heterobasidion irregulare (strain TC 32-1) TaxID=747525 RepID=W4KLX5_HETIT|nr:uncharacterized protein HETIRDRAFT_431393 [Heterobasidion irregulare TC 32-1]ETW86833.1 hypothetical protein HETIRDRAFT_431393 [Heterobasidion irregulare TC 32-1]